jgi:hypothetical protein
MTINKLKFRGIVILHFQTWGGAVGSFPVPWIHLFFAPDWSGELFFVDLFDKLNGKLEAKAVA